MKPKTSAVLITSGTKRLGLAMAKEALALGFDVILHYRSDKRETDTWLGRNRQYRSRVRFMQKDLKPGNAAEFIQAARSDSPGMCGLVNNASVFAEGNLDDPDQLKAVLEPNAIVPAALATSFREKVRKGWIINVTDAHIGTVSTRYQNYRISKLLLTELTRQQALLFAPRIRVNAIAPGAIQPAHGMPLREFQSLADTIPLRRTGNLLAVRRAFAYLVRSDYVTGQVLYVDGGWHLSG